MDAHKERKKEKERIVSDKKNSEHVEGNCIRWHLLLTCRPTSDRFAEKLYNVLLGCHDMPLT